MGGFLEINNFLTMIEQDLVFNAVCNNCLKGRRTDRLIIYNFRSQFSHTSIMSHTYLKGIVHFHINKTDMTVSPYLEINHIKQSALKWVQKNLCELLKKII